jgi:peroxiredoxin
MPWRSLVAAALLLQIFTTALAQGRQVTYKRAVDLYNLGKYAESRDLLETLLSQDTEEFKAYRTYWDLLARTRNGGVRLAQVKKNLSLLAQVVAEKRTEDYYEAYEYGLELTGNTALRQDVHRELLSRYPSGMAAQQEFLNLAQAASDPVKGADLYAEFLVRFPGNVSWTELAARDRFLLVVKNQDKFSPAKLLTASEDWEKHQLAFARQFGMPQSYLQALESIAKQLVSSDPVHALNYCDKASQFVESEWTNTDEFDESYRVHFWPIALQARVQLGSWPQAVRLGKALVKQIETGAFLGQQSDPSLEAEIRLNLGSAFEMTGGLQHSFEQLGLAATLKPSFRPTLQALIVRHPNFENLLASSQATWRAQIAVEQEIREQHYKKTVLSTEIQKLATPFQFLSLSGQTVSLHSYAGTPVVIAFWTTWCGPCHPELAELDQLFASDKAPAAKLLAVSVDTDEAAVHSFLKQNGYRLPVALSHGTIDEAYGATTIPQLYVLDAKGQIRFQVTGYDADGYFKKKLGWMVEAAKQQFNR